MSKKQSKVSEFFSPTGPLAQLSSAYVFRKTQLHMAEFIIEGVSNGCQSITVEAATGTGKTFAYLVAAVMLKKRTIISTATKTLQDQLFTKDLPVIIRAFQSYDGRKVSAMILKGRSNYVCLKKVDEKAYQSELFSGPRQDDFGVLLRWARDTDSGDFAELPFPENAPILGEFDARAEHCIGRACTFYNDCFVTRSRRQAQEADIVVVNHALLCADGAIRAKGGQRESEGTSDGYGMVTSQILPQFDLWIIDEAHSLSDSATRNFGVEISERDIRQLANDLLYSAAFFSHKSKKALEPIAKELVPTFLVFIEILLKGLNSRSIRFLEGLTEDEKYAYLRFTEILRDIDVCVTQIMQSEIDYLSEIKILSRRIHDFFVQTSYIVDGMAQKSGYMAIVERDAKGVSLCAWPINPGNILRSHLWNSEIPVVMTSATLAFNNCTRSFRKQIGISESNLENPELILPSIFDFTNRSALYVAKHLPNPNEEGFQESVHEEIRFLLRLSKGGTLLLFTSHRALLESYLALKEELRLQGYTVLRQGDAPKLVLIKDFISADRDGAAVLFATHSFWEGVDIPGRALRMVIVDRLPFRSISEPLVEARMEDCERRGGIPFKELSLPDAVLTLKQGLGRLLRKDDDAGIAALLDSRLLNKSYGRQILRSLEPMPIVSSRKELEHLWNNHITLMIGDADERA